MNLERGLEMTVAVLAKIAGHLIILALCLLILCAVVFKLPVFIKKCWDQFSNTFFK